MLRPGRGGKSNQRYKEKENRSAHGFSVQELGGCTQCGFQLAKPVWMGPGRR
jgi:hypothetical protein